MAAPGKVQSCHVLLWGQEVGVAAWDVERELASFQYTPTFARGWLEIAPLMIPLNADRIYSFPTLGNETFLGLPGLLADALPDRFGNTLIDVWLARRGRSKADFNPIERLCFMGSRGMGALEFKPAHGPRPRSSVPIEIDELTQIAGEVLRQREKISVNMDRKNEAALKTIIRVGTSAGGARAKAVIAWNPETGEVRSGQVTPPPGFEPWLLKFDGVRGDSLGDPEGFGRIEFAYHKMVRAAGIEMTECRLEMDGRRAHFMTRRFDRTNVGEKIHVLSLCGMMHYDYNTPRTYSYEDALSVVQRLNLGSVALRELYRRMVFNVLARNQDDHTRNIEFLMNSAGTWSLAPAYDMTWSYHEDSRWTNRHQMLVNGKSDQFTKEDLLSVAKRFGIKRAEDVLQEVFAAVKRWPEFAEDVDVPHETINRIRATHRCGILVN